MALVTAIVYIIPLTLLVLLAPHLQAWSGAKILKWVHKVKPLLDAYQGPYKVRYRCWTGVMLVVRLILFAVFSANALGDPKINLLSISLILTLLLATLWNLGILYKKYPVHVLEMFYILNLAVFSIATLYLRGSQPSQQHQPYLTCTMVGSALAVFLVTMMWHLYKLTKHVLWLRHLRVYVHQRFRGPSPDIAQHLPQIPVVQPRPTYSVIDLNMLREPLQLVSGQQ